MGSLIYVKRITSTTARSLLPSAGLIARLKGNIQTAGGPK